MPTKPKKPKPGDWLAVLNEEHTGVIGLLEVVTVAGEYVDGFILFGVDGRPTRVLFAHCLPLLKPEGD